MPDPLPSSPLPRGGASAESESRKHCYAIDLVGKDRSYSNHG
jgi:hypothetical protein